MKKGAYLKDNKLPEEQKRTSQLTMEERQRRKAKRLRKQRQRKQLQFTIGILLILIVALVIVLASIHQQSPIEGTWYMDEVTAYEFRNGGKGAMILPSAEYEFTYSITDNNLSIDFEYEGAKDAQYIFTINGNTLTLEGGNTTTQGTYVLSKSE